MDEDNDPVLCGAELPDDMRGLAADGASCELPADHEGHHEILTLSLLGDEDGTTVIEDVARWLD
jgi:hypothetical protein